MPTLPITRRDVLTKFPSKRPDAISHLIKLTEDWVDSTFSSTRDRVQHGSAQFSRMIWCMLHFNTAEFFCCKYNRLYANNYRPVSVHATATLQSTSRSGGAVLEKEFVHKIVDGDLFWSSLEIRGERSPRLSSFAICVDHSMCGSRAPPAAWLFRLRHNAAQ